MVKSLLKIAWRNIYKRKYYTLINVFGLGLGILCATTLYLFISYHLSFNSYHANAGNIYRAVTELHVADGSVEYDRGAPYILGELSKQGIPAVAEKSTLLEKRTFTVAVNSNTNYRKLFREFENAAFTDDAWFKIFSYQWLSANNGALLSQPYSAVITSSLAKKYFGTDNASGKTITLDNKYIFNITGVIADNPSNTDVTSNLFLSIASVRSMYPEPKEFWDDIGFISSKNQVYFMLRDSASPDGVDKQIQAITKKPLEAYSGAYQFHLQPLHDIHFNNKYGVTISKTLLLILALVAMAIILVACVNFINMAIAQSLTRAKEIGTRKIIGGSNTTIFWQFIAETGLVTTAATLVAVAALINLLPTINTWLNLSLTVKIGAIQLAVLLALLITFASGVYPAMVLSRFKPVNALKNIIAKNSPSSKLPRGFLIVIQNVIAQLLIICTLVITAQTNYLKKADMGFDKEAVVVVPVPGNAQINTSFLRNKLISQPGIKSVSFCYRPPASTSYKGGMVRYNNGPFEKFAVRTIVGDEQYVKTFGLKLLAGRDLSVNDTNASAYLVNQQLLLKLGVKKPEDAIGRKFLNGDVSDKYGVIVGVVQDFHNHSLHEGIEPVAIAQKSELYEYAAVKILNNDRQHTLAAIKGAWQQAFPNDAYQYDFLDGQINDFYIKETTITRLISIGCAIAIIISCLGLLGLVSLIITQRTKEIGIRKVLGASVFSIMRLLAENFVILIVVAFGLSAPIAWLIMHNWLQDFTYRIEISWIMFAAAGMSAIVIAVVTVSLQSLRVALSNPVKSIRNN